MVRKNLKIQFFTKIQPQHLAIIVLALAILLSIFNYGNPSLVSNVQGQYLIEATNLYEGESPRYTRGPVYAYLLALSFALGEDHFSLAHWITQVVYFLTIVMVFIFAHQLYGKWVAFVSTAAIIFSIRIFLVSWTIGVAFLVPLFILTSFFIYLKGLQENHRWMLFSAGILIGLAFLTKENSLLYLYFPLSLMLFVRDYRSKFAVQGIFLYLSGMFTLIIPWAIFLFLKNQNLLVLLGEFNTMGISFFGHTSIGQYVFDVTFGGTYGTAKELAKEMSLFLIMIIGIIYIVWGGFIKNNKSDKIFVSLFLPSIPVLMTYGIFLDGFRQIILSILFLHIALGKIIIQIPTFNRKKQIYIFCAGALSIFLMVMLDSDRIKRYSEQGVTELPLIAIQKRVTGKFGLEVIPGGRFNKDLYKAANWVNQNVKHESLLGTGSYFDHAMAFFTNLNYRYGANLPKRSHVCFSNNVEPLIKVKKEHNQIIQITTPKSFRKISEEFRYRPRIVSLYKHDLIDFLKYITKDKLWIIIHDNEGVNFPIARSLIFDLSKKVYSNESVEIFETIPGEYDYDTLISNKSFNILAKGDITNSNWLDTKKDLLWLKDINPDNFERYSSCFLSQESIDLKKLLRTQG